MLYKSLAAASALLVATVGTAARGDDSRAMSYSFNVAITSDYVFRGFTQTAGAPTGQAGVDIGWGKFYAGVWASGLNFGADTVSGKSTARAEVDLYAGFKPEWNKITFDLGVIYYAYPGALDNRTTTLIDGEANYVELKAGMSREIWKDGTLSSTLFYSPEYTNSTGRVFTSETQFAQVLPHKIDGWTTTLSALFGTQFGHDARYVSLVGNGDKRYSYWNAGVTFGWEKFTIDFRYWDTDIKNNGAATNFCSGKVFGCDDRYVATLKFTY